MPPIDPQALEQEYRTSQNVDVRIALYQRFSTQPQPWQRWLFDRLSLPAGARVLEVGCGPGTFWSENRDRLAPDWQVTLSDFSPGMLETVRHNLRDLPLAFHFEVVDLRTKFPFQAGSFAAVIANHVLFHVPDVAHTLSEIHRVLRPGGVLYATTLGHTHLQELREIVSAFAELPPAPEFVLESGNDELSRWFAPITLHPFDNALAVTEAGPVVDYALSYEWLKKSDRKAITRAVEAAMARQGGVFHITVDVGLFVATRL